MLYKLTQRNQGEIIFYQFLVLTSALFFELSNIANFTLIIHEIIVSPLKLPKLH